MKTTLSILIAGIGIGVSVFAAESSREPLADPIPEKIVKGDITIALQRFARVPFTEDSGKPRQTNEAYARIQYMGPIPDGSGRLVINDLRGLLYITDEDGSAPTVFLDMRKQDIGFDDSMFPNETGLAGFAFHPEFAATGKPGFGKFYTSFSVSSDSGLANYLDDDDGNHASVIREWTADEPASNVFSGTTREIFRMGQFDQNHNIGNIAFNYAPTEGTTDYGLLYASFGDGGGANDPQERGQSMSEPMSAIIRIDPLGEGGNSYGIPVDNPFVGVEGVAPEIWAY